MMADNIDLGLAEMYPGVCSHDCCPLDYCKLNRGGRMSDRPWDPINPNPPSPPWKD